MSNKPAKQTDNQSSSDSQQKTTAQISRHYSGIIPPPEFMSHYAEINPDFPNRILSLTENEGKHRQQMERKIVNFSFISEMAGIVSGLFAVAMVCLLCYYFIEQNNPKEASHVAIAVIVGLAGVFVFRKFTKKDTNS
ncbi:MAG: DUF2335 domain-containing protein [Bacteroidetes bacterium]|nr:MAG: DUF2335 domain-containing protein [Bacteroidota bacterium]